MSTDCKDIGVKLGELREPIVIQTHSTGKDDTGAPLITYSTYKTLLAKVEYTGGSETEDISKETAKTRVQFTVRYRNDIDAKMQVVWDSDTYNILGFLEIGREKFTKIFTELAE